MSVTTTSEQAPRLAVIASLKRWGGIEGKLVTLFREFVSRGVRPELVCIRGGEVPYPDRIPSEVRIVHLQTRSKLDGVPAVIRYIRESRPSVVLTAKDHAAQVALLARMIGRLDVPVFVKVTNTLDHVARRPAQRLMIRRLYPRANRVIANSTGVARDLETTFGLPRDRVSVIYNPTVVHDIRERAGAAVDHPWLSSRGGAPVILGVGRLTAQKDFPTLISAFARVYRDRDCRLLILGDGPERDDLVSMAASLGLGDVVDLPGFVADALPYMARAALFVLSSRYEGLSNVLIESLAVGTPAVSTDCPSGSAEILGEGHYGRLVEIGNPKAMADAIARELDAPTSAQTLARAVERFRPGPVADRYLQVMGFAGAVDARGTEADSGGST